MVQPAGRDRVTGLSSRTLQAHYRKTCNDCIVWMNILSQMLLLKTHTWPIWNNRLNKWALWALHRAPWPLGLILPHELSARTLGCYHRKGWPTALRQPHLTAPRQRSCREAPGLFSHTWFLGQLKKKLWEIQNGSQAPMSWHLHSCVPSACQADITSSSTGFWRTINLLSKTRKWGPTWEAKRDLPLQGEGQVSKSGSEWEGKCWKECALDSPC